MLKGFLYLFGFYWIYEKWLFRQIQNRPMPEHIGIIIDGNRRWARSKRFGIKSGYNFGAEKVELLLKWCLELGIKELTVFAFSMDNFKRPKYERDLYMEVLTAKLQKALEDSMIHRSETKIKAIGRVKRLPGKIKSLLIELEDSTKNYNKHYLNIAVAYGGHTEIVDAIKIINEKIVTGEINPSQIDEDMIEKHLYTSHLPKSDVDLIIRTSGEERLSGFLLWQSANTYLHFIDVFWPQFRRIDLLRAIRTYQNFLHKKNK
jgi:tritrans,polycis-undecaprenyl-diphosphate synthase [geranylgeranyl-diphosphate specific]